MSSSIEILGQPPEKFSVDEIKAGLSGRLPEGSAISLNFGSPEIRPQSKNSIIFNILAQETPPSAGSSDGINLCPADSKILVREVLSITKYLAEQDKKNPLTGLPGNKAIRHFLEHDRSALKKPAFCYFDISDFKAYNEIYGFFQGDFVIFETASAALFVKEKYSYPSLFIGHIGGDDFFSGGEDEEVRGFSEKLASHFDALREKFYSAPDLKSGFIKSFARDGSFKKFPLMTLNIVVVPHGLDFPDMETMGEFATQSKETIKNLKEPGKSFVLIADGRLLNYAKNLKGFISDPGISMRDKKAFIEAIGEIRNTAFEELLVSALKDEKSDYRLKKSILYSLGRLCSKKSEEALSGFVADPNPHLRTRAIEALGNFGTRHREKIKKALLDKNTYVRMAAITACSDFLDKEISLALIKLYSAGSVYEKKKIIQALSKSKGEDNRIFLESLFLREKELRPELVELLSCVADAGTIDTLLTGLSPENISTSLEAVSLILEKNQGLTVPAGQFNTLSAYLPSFSRQALRCFVRILGHSSKDNRAAFSFLREKLADPDPGLSTLAFFSLKPFIGNLTLSFFSKYIKSDDVAIRLKAVEMLALKKDVYTTELLRQLLKDESFIVRKKAAEAIISAVLSGK